MPGLQLSALHVVFLLAALACSSCEGGVRSIEDFDGALPVLPSSGRGSGADEGSVDWRLDLGALPDAGEDPYGICIEGAGDEPPRPQRYSLIWIANSTEGTVSKIDTETGEEQARYLTGPREGLDDPSRTSVGFSGAVAVANRAGGIVKIAGELSQCVDKDGNGNIETSSGPEDVLTWDTDECVLWHRYLPSNASGNTAGPRPVAWDAGVSNDPCFPDDDRVWVGWYDPDRNRGYFNRLHGSDGTLDAEVVVDPWSPSLIKSYGPYGGAVDGNGAFWVLGHGGPLVRIDGGSLEYQLWELPQDVAGYGLTLDAHGEPWIAGLFGDVLHFDTATQTFETLVVSGQSLRGLQVDADGIAWIAANEPCGLIRVDTNAKQVVSPMIDLPGCGTPVGVSIDVEGNIWLPDQTADLAFRVTPGSWEVEVTAGLVGPYTYSDMTGAVLNLVFDPLAEG